MRLGSDSLWERGRLRHLTTWNRIFIGTVTISDGQVIDTITPRHANAKVNNKLVKSEPVWNPEMSKSWRRYGNTVQSEPKETR